MNRARGQLAAGIDPSAQAAFRQSVAETLAAAREACRRQSASPGDLPGPSRRAYHYLAGIDLDHLPTPRGSTPASVEAVRIANLVASRRRVHKHLARSARHAMKTGRPVEVAPILREIHETLAEVGVLLERAGASPPALPEPSRRAYQWLSFLAEPENLMRHKETLAAALAVDPRVSVDINHIAALYSAWRQDERVSLTVSEAFVGAPAEVIQGLVKLALPHTRKRPLRARIAAYAESERFKARLREVEASGEAMLGDPAGEHVSLTEVFDQVDRDYFDNSLAKPRLAWSRTITGREFGNYQPSTDVLTVSLALDAPGVPAYVVEFVMYHELLHKALGIEVVNGRRQAHTARFRRRERRFARYPEAEAFLKALADRQ